VHLRKKLQSMPSQPCTHPAAGPQRSSAGVQQHKKQEEKKKKKKKPDCIFAFTIFFLFPFLLAGGVAEVEWL
jgi:hypothetical protein